MDILKSRTMVHVIAMANHKGGVAKTSTVSAVGDILASKGKRVLLVDLDPQSNLTESLSLRDYDRTVYDAFRERKDLPIFPVKKNLDIVPSTIDLAAAEMELAATIERETILADLLEPVLQRYDYILLDCPPSLGLLTLNALTAATDLYVPLTAEALPSRGLQKLLDLVALVRRRLNRDLQLSGIIITIWNGTNLNKQVEAALRERFGDVVFKTRIRKNVSIAEAPLAYQSIVSFAPRSNGAADYSALAAEILTR